MQGRYGHYQALRGLAGQLQASSAPLLLAANGIEAELASKTGTGQNAVHPTHQGSIGAGANTAPAARSSGTEGRRDTEIGRAHV